MEKYIRSFSKGIIIMTFVFFMSFFGGIAAQAYGWPTFLYQFCVISANGLLFLIPIAFVIVFGMGLSVIFKKFLSMQSKAITKKVEEKFPMVWFIFAAGCFVAFFIFMNFMFSIAEI